MKVILTHEVSGLGSAGDVVDVKPGFARNYLSPQGFAVAWSRGGQKQVEAIASGRAARAVKSLEEAQSIKGNLEAQTVTVTAHAGDSGRLFGAVTSKEIAEAVKAGGGPELDRRTIEIPTPIKAVGPAQALGIDDPLVRGIPTVWRDTPAPYGPLFILIAKWITQLCGDNVLAGVIALLIPKPQVDQSEQAAPAEGQAADHRDEPKRIFCTYTAMMALRRTLAERYDLPDFGEDAAE